MHEVRPRTRGTRRGAYTVPACSEAWTLTTTQPESTCHNPFHPSASKCLSNAKVKTETSGDRQVGTDTGLGTGGRKGQDVVGGVGGGKK